MRDGAGRAARGTIALAAGGTGGHLFPAEALARELQARGRDVVLYTEARGARHLALEGLPNRVLPAAAWRACAQVAAAAVSARARRSGARGHERRGVGLSPIRLFPSFGRLAGQPRLPLLLHEQFCAEPATPRGLRRPCRRLLQLPGSRQRARQCGDATLCAQASGSAGSPYPPQADGAPLRLLVVGGSQGAAVFGRVLPAALALLPDALRARLRLALQYRGDDTEAVARTLRKAGIQAELLPFFDDMAARLRDAQLVITRAGATTIATVWRAAGDRGADPQGGSRAEQRAMQRWSGGAGCACARTGGFTAQALAVACRRCRQRRCSPTPRQRPRAWGDPMRPRACG